MLRLRRRPLRHPRGAAVSRPIFSIFVDLGRRAARQHQRAHRSGSRGFDVRIANLRRQRVEVRLTALPITWTACHLGGGRAWFRCNVSSNGRFCGRRVALLYAAGELFACRHCYGLAYASQREPMRRRGLGKAQKIRMQLGGSGNMFDDFPQKPKGMHRRTYIRLPILTTSLQYAAVADCAGKERSGPQDRYGSAVCEDGSPRRWSG